MNDEKILVEIDVDLEELIPEFLEMKRSDIRSIDTYIKEKDFEKIRIIGHSMKGAGSGYGFDRITEIGADIERAAENDDSKTIALKNAELSDYLNRVEMIYVEKEE